MEVEVADVIRVILQDYSFYYCSYLLAAVFAELQICKMVEVAYQNQVVI